ncbi:TRAP transporter permease DctM/Q [Rhodobacteraceae bacterium WD3A24]|nr:TRAP transporter permease DctM/Q [Rhodobacteraceae bacterium WD3A24]
MTMTVRALRTAAFLFGLFIAVIGVINVMPSWGILPRLGPFPVEWYRPLFFFASMGAIILVQAQKWAEQPAWGPLPPLFHAALFALTAWFCWDYFIVSRIMADSILFFTEREAWIATAMTVIVLWACWRAWGLPIAVLGALAFVYLATGQYWPGVLATVPTNMAETVAINIWYHTDQGMLGSIMGILLSTVLPFILLGAILEGCGAGNSMIRVSFRLLRRLRGGPAYAAVAASALFGTVSGSAVANVVGTGVVTIPMIKRRGFSANFAGAVEATASTGGQILPPIMGAAALVMADYVGVTYLTVITAVLVPAIAFYASLFLAIYFEANRLGVQDNEPEEFEISNQDWLNLILVFAPIGVVVWLLIGGLSPAGASIAAIGVLIPLSFINPAIRRQPWRLVVALSNGGRTVGQLAIAIAIVGIVVSTLSATGMPTKFAVLLSDASNSSLMAALSIAALGCIVLGMGMPTLPAYIAIVVIIGPTLQSFGMQPLAAHMFVFFFGVASVITPPVAIAAYAAAAIAKGKPIATSVQCVRIGAMIFLIPFAFAFNPELLVGMLPDIGAGALALGMGRLALALYMCSSALVGFDRARLTPLERLGRLAATVLLIAAPSWAYLGGAALGVALLAWHLVLAPRLARGAIRI